MSGKNADSVTANIDPVLNVTMGAYWKDSSH